MGLWLNVHAPVFVGWINLKPSIIISEWKKLSKNTQTGCQYMCM